MDNVLRGPLREILRSNLLVEEDQLLVEEKLQNGISYRSSKTVIFWFLSFAGFLYGLSCLSEANGNFTTFLWTKFSIYFI